MYFSVVSTLQNQPVRCVLEKQDIARILINLSLYTSMATSDLLHFFTQTFQDQDFRNLEGDIFQLPVRNILFQRVSPCFMQNNKVVLQD